MTELIGGPWDGKEVERVPAIYCKNKDNKTALFWRIYMDKFLNAKEEYMIYKGLSEEQFIELVENYNRAYTSAEKTFYELQGFTND